MAKNLNAQLLIRRGRTEDWISDNSVILAMSEIGYDIDRKVFKVGDGVSRWKDLRASIFPIDETGRTLLDAGADNLHGFSVIPITLSIMTESSDRYSEAYVPSKGELVSILEGNNQYLKVGDGSTNVKNLRYVTPNDDARIDVVYGNCGDFSK